VEVFRGLCTRRGFTGPGEPSLDNRRGFSVPANAEPVGGVVPKGRAPGPAATLTEGVSPYPAWRALNEEPKALYAVCGAGVYFLVVLEVLAVLQMEELVVPA